METTDLRGLLEALKSGKIGVESVLGKLEQPPEVNLGFAHVDLQRRDRCGFPEVIFCQGKSCDWVEGVVAKLIEAGQDCLATRVSEDQAHSLAKRFPQAQQDRVARTFWLPVSKREVRGRV